MLFEAKESFDDDAEATWVALASAARAVAHTGMYCWDVASGHIQWDRVMCEIFGYPAPGSLLYSTFLNKVHPEDREFVHNELENAVDECRDSTIVFRIRRPDGQERVLLGSGRVEPAESGCAARMYGSATDLTNKLHTLMPDMVELQFLRTVLANTPNIVSLFDRQFRHLYVSPSIERITGKPASAFLGKTNEELGMPTENCREWRAVMEEVLRTGQPGKMGFSFSDPNGVLKSFETRIVPVYDVDGELASLVSIVSDVTDHARTVDELREKQERLAAADHFKDVFISVLAHELRNPLAPIRSALQLLRLTRQEDVVDRACKVIERQTAQMVNLVDDLLDLSRVREGKFSLHFETMDVVAAIQMAIESVDSSFREKQQSVTLEILNGPVMMNGDPTRIVQVFVNLLCNAAKFTGFHGHILVQATRQGKDFLFTITDNGCGMNEAQLGALFTLFLQHDRAGGRASGLGIGLTLVRQIVEAHGGTVSANSAGIGKGSTFTVNLPLAD